MVTIIAASSKRNTCVLIVIFRYLSYHLPPRQLEVITMSYVIKHHPRSRHILLSH
jgi:hypothetical protein